MQALARRNHPGSQVGRELTGAGFGREVAFALVVVDLRVCEGVETAPGFLFAGRPQCAQRLARRCKTSDGCRYRIAVDVQLCLFAGRLDQRRHRAVQAFIADLAELAEHLKVGFGFGQYRAGLEQQLVKVAVESDAFGLQGHRHRGVALAFVDAIFFVDVHSLNIQLHTKFEQHRRGLIPMIGGTQQQRDVQLAQATAQLTQVAQPEVDLARGVVMFQPLLRAQQIHGNRRAARCGGREGGVVMLAQVAAQPDQLHRGFH